MFWIVRIGEASHKKSGVRNVWDILKQYATSVSVASRLPQSRFSHAWGILNYTYTIISSRPLQTSGHPGFGQRWLRRNWPCQKCKHIIWMSYLLNLYPCGSNPELTLGQWQFLSFDSILFHFISLCANSNECDAEKANRLPWVRKYSLQCCHCIFYLRRL